MDVNPYESPLSPGSNAQSLDGAPWSLFPSFGATFGVYAISVVGFGLTICGCHFHLIAVPFTVIPIAWTALMLASYKSKAEFVYALVSIVATTFWLFLTWQANLRFLF